MSTEERLALLSQLWLHEPDAPAIQAAKNALGLADVNLSDAARTYTDVFLLNVFPYGTVFTDADAELNGAGARLAQRAFDVLHFSPPDLTSVAAPDHLGICVAALARMNAMVQNEVSMLQGTLLEFAYAVRQWAPVCCIAVVREPTANAFYRQLARTTCSAILHLLAGLPSADADAREDDDAGTEIDAGSADPGLHEVIAFLMAPVRCGVFLSRSTFGELARRCGARIPFGSRFAVAESLLLGAGQSDATTVLRAAMLEEIAAWCVEYETLAQEHENWQEAAGRWLRRANAAQEVMTRLM